MKKKEQITTEFYLNLFLILAALGFLNFYVMGYSTLLEYLKIGEYDCSNIFCYMYKYITYMSLALVGVASGLWLTLTLCLPLMKHWRMVK